MNRSKIQALILANEISEEQALLISEDQKTMIAILRGVIPNTKPRVRERIAEYLNLLSRGHWHREAIKKAGASWAQINSCNAHYPPFMALYKACKTSGEDTRQAYREERLDRFALRGVLEPVFHKGKEIGKIRKYNPKYLEMALKGGDKEGKFIERKSVEHKGTVIQYHIHGVAERGTTPTTINITPKNATKTQLEADNE